MDNQDELKSQLQSNSREARFVAAEKLAMLSSEARFAAVELVQACADEEPIRQQAVAALEDLGAPPIECVAVLSNLVTSADSLVAYWAITLLSRLENEASECESALCDALSAAKDLAVRERAALALGKIGATSPRSVQRLQEAAASDHPRLSRLAQQSLGR